VALADGRLGEGTGDPGLAHLGGSDHDQVAVSLDPLRLGQAENGRPVEAARTSEVEVLDAGRGAQAGRLHVAVEAPVLPNAVVRRHPTHRFAASPILLESLCEDAKQAGVDGSGGPVDPSGGGPARLAP
jgi:hypothetical protein